jgi:hypothetical protein
MKKQFGIFTLENELEETVKRAKESDMEYIRTEELSQQNRLLLGIPVFAPKIYNVIVAGESKQFDKLVGNQELTRVF